MLDYKDILTKRYVLRLSLREIAEQTGAGGVGHCIFDIRGSFSFRYFYDSFDASLCQFHFAADQFFPRPGRMLSA